MPDYHGARIRLWQKQDMDTSRLREALITSCSLCTVYALGFYWHLEKPFWAAYTVLILMDLPTLGQTIQKGLLRIAGTMLGALTALLVFALTGGNIFRVMGCLSLYMGVMLYLMLSHPQWRYFYYISAFVCMIVVLMSALTPQNTFSLAVARTGENLLGIGVYMGISLLFLLPTSSRRFSQLISELAAAHHKLQTAAKGDAAQQIPQLEKIREAAELMLPMAEIENPEIFLRRRFWREVFITSRVAAEAQGNEETKSGSCAARRLRELLAYLNHTGPRPPDAARSELIREARAEGPDPDRFRTPWRVLAMFWAVCAVWTCCNPPGIAIMGFPELAMMFVLTGVYTKQASLASMLAPFLRGIVIMFIPYAFIYPLMTNVAFLLGTVFAISSVICLTFPGQKNASSRLGYTIPWLALGQLENMPDFNAINYISEGVIMFSALLAVAAIQMVLFPQSPLGKASHAA